MPTVPTTKPSRKLYYSEEELRHLLAIWKELRNPGRRREPGYIGQKLTFNRWLATLTKDGADRARGNLAVGALAPTSGTVEGSMTKPKPPTKQRAKTAQTPEVTAEPKKRGRKPKGPTERTTMNLPLGLKDRVWKAIKTMTKMDEDPPVDLTAFAVAAMSEKIDSIMLRYAARKSSK